MDQTRSAEGGALVVHDRSSEDIIKQLVGRVDTLSVEYNKILLAVDDLKKSNQQDQNVKEQLSDIETRLAQFTQRALMNHRKRIIQESTKLAKKLEGLSENIDQESEKFENILENAHRKMDEISEQLQMFQATFHATSHAYRYPITALSEKVVELDSRLSILEGGEGRAESLEPHDVVGEDHHDPIIMND
ncbi:PREDICTED: uncharacterized protein LOC109593595 [Amphimedon queenslandica]|uniref:Uncharacterized protein n=2 Tax=Amphimedon queenslandica TaxID=400682 RepID=A0AAN0K4B9_AMPQE|nr:PREDICTED: uncharacterized protein LOC109593595 [Amphimedon queenslandica]|eukprot:XP_019864166.1 PREDICTED: uncharacterized protein LOC109593595 [Amphimedon queenslandica]